MLHITAEKRFGLLVYVVYYFCEEKAVFNSENGARDFINRNLFKMKFAA